MGWRYLLFTIGAITLAVFILRFFVFKFRETPKFLVSRGMDDKAIKTLQHMGHINKKPCMLTTDVFEQLQGEHSSVGSGDSATGKALLGGGAKQLEGTWKDKLKTELSRYRLLFDSWGMTYLTVLIWLTYILDYSAFTIAGKFSRSLTPGDQISL